MFRASLAASLALVACGGVQERSDDNPVVESISPATGPQTGGTEVTLIGRGLDFGDDTPTRVIVGSAIVDAAVVDDTTLTFVTPAGTEGPAQVIVFHGGGAIAALEPFTYAPLPSVREIVPAIATPGSQVTIRGSGFQDNAPGTIVVELGSAALESIQVTSDTVLTGTVPGAEDPPFAAVDVTVTTTNGAATLGGAFKYTGQGLLGIRGVRDRNGQRNELNRGKWFFIDPVTAQARFILQSPIPVTKATLAADGTVVALADRSSPRQIGALAGAELELTDVRTLSAGARAVGLVVDGTDYFEFEDGTTLRRYDFATGTLQVTVPLDSTIGAPACIFRNNATTLFAIDRLSGPLRTINKATGTVLIQATLNGPPALECHGATRIGSDTFIIGWDRAQRASRLFRLDIASASLIEIGEITEGGESIAIRSVVPTPASF